MQTRIATPTSEAALWERLLGPAGVDLSPAAARYILSLRFPRPDVDRMHQLAEIGRAGTLTAEERCELDAYERVGHALSVMKSRARQALKGVRRVR
jgi:hypothetical protein